MIFESTNKKTHLVKLENGQPIYDNFGGCKSQCGVWIQIEKMYLNDEVEVTCKNCIRKQSN